MPNPLRTILNALIAAGGNSSAARAARAKLQWRDRYGRFINMGGGVKFKVRGKSGSIRSVTGRFFGAIDGETGQVYVTNDSEGLKDGFYEVKSGNAQEILASIDPKDLEKAGIELGKDVDGATVGERADADIPTGATIPFSDAPVGWEVSPTGAQGVKGKWVTEDGELTLTHGTVAKNGKRQEVWAVGQQGQPKATAYTDMKGALESIARLDDAGTDPNAPEAADTPEASAPTRESLQVELDKQNAALERAKGNIDASERVDAKITAIEDQMKALDDAPEASLDSPDAPEGTDAPVSDENGIELQNVAPEGFVVPTGKSTTDTSPEGLAALLDSNKEYLAEDSGKRLVVDSDKNTAELYTSADTLDNAKAQAGGMGASEFIDLKTGEVVSNDKNVSNPEQVDTPNEDSNSTPEQPERDDTGADSPVGTDVATAPDGGDSTAPDGPSSRDELNASIDKLIADFAKTENPAAQDRIDAKIKSLEEKVKTLETENTPETPDNTKSEDTEPNAPEKSDELTDEQLQDIVDATLADGGISVKADDPSKTPTDGYMVAIERPSPSVPEDDFGIEDVRSFIETNKDELSADKNFFGTWVSDGDVVLDISENFDSLEEAVQAGTDRDQVSIWDVANKKEISTGGKGDFSPQSEKTDAPDPQAELDTLNEKITKLDADYAEAAGTKSGDRIAAALEKLDAEAAVLKDKINGTEQTDPESDGPATDAPSVESIQNSIDTIQSDQAKLEARLDRDKTGEDPNGLAEQIADLDLQAADLTAKLEAQTQNNTKEDNGTERTDTETDGPDTGGVDSSSPVPGTEPDRLDGPSVAPGQGSESNSTGSLDFPEGTKEDFASALEANSVASEDALSLDSAGPNATFHLAKDGKSGYVLDEGVVRTIFGGPDAPLSDVLADARARGATSGVSPDGDTGIAFAQAGFTPYASYEVDGVGGDDNTTVVGFGLFGDAKPDSGNTVTAEDLRSLPLVSDESKFEAARVEYNQRHENLEVFDVDAEWAGEDEAKKRLLEAVSQMEVGSGDHNADLWAFLKSIGFSEKPELVDYQDLDSVEGTRLYRALTAENVATAREYAAQFRTGDSVSHGSGMYGTGTYFSSSEHVILNYGNKTTGSAGIIDGVLPPDTKIVSSEDIAKIQQDLIDEFGDFTQDKDVVRDKALAAIIADQGMLASVLGYDAIEVGNEEQYYVVLNRGKLVVARERTKDPHTGQFMMPENFPELSSLSDAELDKVNSLYEKAFRVPEADMDEVDARTDRLRAELARRTPEAAAPVRAPEDFPEPPPAPRRKPAPAAEPEPDASPEPAVEAPEETAPEAQAPSVSEPEYVGFSDESETDAIVRELEAYMDDRDDDLEDMDPENDYDRYRIEQMIGALEDVENRPTYVTRDENGEVNGVMLTRDESGRRPRDQKLLGIDSVYTREAGNGAGTALVRKAAQEARDRDRALIVVGALASAKPFYAKMGARLLPNLGEGDPDSPENLIQFGMGTWTSKDRDALADGVPNDHRTSEEKKPAPAEPEPEPDASPEPAVEAPEETAPPKRNVSDDQIGTRARPENIKLDEPLPPRYTLEGVRAELNKQRAARDRIGEFLADPEGMDARIDALEARFKALGGVEPTPERSVLEDSVDTPTETRESLQVELDKQLAARERAGGNINALERIDARIDAVEAKIKAMDAAEPTPERSVLEELNTAIEDSASTPEAPEPDTDPEAFGLGMLADDVLDSVMAGKDLSPEREAELRDRVDTDYESVIKELNNEPNRANTETRLRDPEAPAPAPPRPATQAIIDEESDPHTVPSPDAIYNDIIEGNPDAEILPNGDIRLGTRTQKGKTFEVRVRRTKSNRFFVYMLETNNATGVRRARRYGHDIHSYKTLRKKMKSTTAKLGKNDIGRNFSQSSNKNAGNAIEIVSPGTDLGDSPMSRYIDGTMIVNSPSEKFNVLVKELVSRINSGEYTTAQLKKFLSGQEMPAKFLVTLENSMKARQLVKDSDELMGSDAEQPAHISYNKVELQPGMTVDWTDHKLTRPQKDEDGKTIYMKDKNGRFVYKYGAKVALNEPNPYYGRVFRGEVRHLKYKSINGMGYAVGDSVVVVFEDRNIELGRDASWQGQFTSANIKVVDPSDPMTEAFYAKKEEKADKNAPQFGVPETGTTTVKRPKAPKVKKVKTEYNNSTGKLALPNQEVEVPRGQVEAVEQAENSTVSSTPARDLKPSTQVTTLDKEGNTQYETVLSVDTVDGRTKLTTAQPGPDSTVVEVSTRTLPADIDLQTIFDDRQMVVGEERLEAVRYLKSLLLERDVSQTLRNDARVLGMEGSLEDVTSMIDIIRGLRYDEDSSRGEGNAIKTLSEFISDNVRTTDPALAQRIDLATAQDEVALDEATAETSYAVSLPTKKQINSLVRSMDKVKYDSASEAKRGDVLHSNIGFGSGTVEFQVLDPIDADTGELRVRVLDAYNVAFEIDGVSYEHGDVFTVAPSTLDGVARRPPNRRNLDTGAGVLSRPGLMTSPGYFIDSPDIPVARSARRFDNPDAVAESPDFLEDLQTKGQVLADLDEVRTLSTSKDGAMNRRAEIVEMSDGSIVFIKLADGRGQLASSTVTQNEVLSNRVAHAVGLKNIDLGLRGDGAVVMSIAPGVEGDDMSARQRLDMSEDPETLDSRVRLGLMDFLIGNVDRHEGNWFYNDDTKEITPIDHGMASFEIADAERGRSLIDILAQVRAGTLSLTPDQLMGIQGNLQALYPEFASMGRERSYAAMMFRFRRLIRMAKTNG